MDFGEAVQAGFRNYVKFSGRASVPELGYWVLFIIIGGMVAAIIDAILGTPLGKIFGLITFLPNISVVVRRLHDVDRSGWWYLLIVIPLVGIIVLIVWCIRQPTPGDNRFGPEPTRTRR